MNSLQQVFEVLPSTKPKQQNDIGQSSPNLIALAKENQKIRSHSLLVYEVNPEIESNFCKSRSFSH